jgi:hypothetical protein
MKFSNIAAIFAPTLLASPAGDSANLRDVMMQMRCVDMLLKLEEDVWEDVGAMVISASIRTSASPQPGRKGAAGAADVKREPSTSRLAVAKMDEWQLLHEKEKSNRQANILTSNPISNSNPNPDPNLQP